MKRFLKNILLFGIPVIVYMITIGLIDPYNYLKVTDLIDETRKAEISREVAPHLYKMLAYKNDPKGNITLGDSRTNALYEAFDDQHWSNLAFGGGTLKEMVQVFWWAADNYKLDTVLMGISLNLYNKFNKRFYVEETIKTQSNFFSYAFNKTVFRSTYLIIKSLLSKKSIDINKTSLTREEFWQFQLTNTPKKFYSQISYPDNYYEDLQRISRYCSENHIALIIWIPPTHIDFQNRIKEYNIENANERFLEDMRGLGSIYDYNYPCELTRDSSNFRDPLHFTIDVAKLVRDEILTGKPYMARHWEITSQP